MDRPAGLPPGGSGSLLPGAQDRAPRPGRDPTDARLVREPSVVCGSTIRLDAAPDGVGIARCMYGRERSAGDGEPATDPPGVSGIGDCPSRLAGIADLATPATSHRDDRSQESS